MSSCLILSMRSILVRHLVNKHGSICQRLFSVSNPTDSGEKDAGDSGEKVTKGQYIPERIRKRLKDRNLTIDDLEYGTRTTPQTSAKKSAFSDIDLRSAVEDAIVDEIPNPEFPSDAVQAAHIAAHKRRNQEQHAYRPSIDPQTTSILLFPGQGSQFVGMGQKTLSYPGVIDMFDKASDILGYDLLNICINGPKDKLDKTVFCQPAVMVTSLAAVEKLKADHPGVLDTVVGCAGFSVGEYAALVYSGVLKFEDTVLLIKARAEAMQKASEVVPSGMLTVFCDHKTKLLTAMVAAREYCRQKLGIEEPVCHIANYLCTDCKVVAGHEEALDFLQLYGKEWGLKRTKRLPVSGAFHTPLMRQGSATKKFVDLLEKTEFSKPEVPIHCNIDGKIYTDPLGFRKLLRNQVSNPIRWEQTLHILYTRKPGSNFPNTYEVGPARQLGYLLKLTNAKAYEHYTSIDV